MSAKVTSLRNRWMVLVLSLVSLAAAPSDDRLIESVKKRDPAAVRAVLTEQADVNASAVDGTTALHWAAHLDDLDIVDVLIRVGANAKAVNRYGVTPLSLACTNGNAAIIERLLRAGADPNTASPEGETALMTAARTGKGDAVKVLLGSGADVNAKETWRGQTALMWAVAERHLAAAQALIEHGADVHARSDAGFTPLLFAVRTGDFELVRALLAAGANVNDAGKDGTTALVLAIMNAHYALAGFLVEQGADPNTDAPGGPALHHVVRTRNYEYAKAYRPAPLRTGSLDALDLTKGLLAHGANPNAQIVKPLPRQGAFDNNYLNLNGATPFLLAARAGDVTTMRLLVAHGADPLLPTNEKTTPLMVAAGMGYVQGQSVGSERDRLDAVTLAWELGADLHAVNDAGETAMHGAATGGANSVVLFLVEKGAQLDVKSKQGWTPLTIADGTRSAFRAWPHTAELFRQLMARDAPK